MADATMHTTLTLLDGQVRFEATAAGQAPLSVDYPQPLGTGQGYNSLQLFLISYASCTATTLISLMRDRMRSTIIGFSMEARGFLRKEHPKAFERIELDMEIVSPDATEEKVTRALVSVEEKLCPVSAMIRGNVKTRMHFRIVNTKEAPEAK